MRFKIISAAILILTLGFVGETLVAQDLHPSRRPSPMGMSRITVGDTYIRVVYSRPYKRDRDNIFGTTESEALVPYGEVWRTGANEATEITVTNDVTIGDQILAAGTYSIFTTPNEESWTVHFNSALGLTGAGTFDPENGFTPVELGSTEALVVTASVGTLEEEVDQLTIAMDATDSGADMCLRWIITEVCVPFTVANE